MKILIVNLHSSLNAGDDVLTRVSIDLLRRSFPGAQITLAMNDPESFFDPNMAIGSFMSWIKPQGAFGKGMVIGFLALGLSLVTAVFYRLFRITTFLVIPNRFRPLLSAYFEADLVVSSAGNFLYSSGRFGFAFLMNIGAMAYALLLGKPLYSMPQTIGPIKRRWEGWALGWIARHMRLVFVRDPISMALLKQLNGWHERCLLVPDVAFVFPGGGPGDGQAVLDAAAAKLRKPRLGVTLINWGAQNRTFQGQDVYETAVSAAIRTFIEQTGGQAVIFSQVRGPSLAEDDCVPARRVHIILADLGNQVVLVEQENISADSLKAAYGLMDVFLGTRLHSNIFALTASVPAIMIQYQYKTRGVVEMLGLEEWVIEIEHVTASLLTERLLALWEQQSTVKRKIHQATAKVAQQVEQIGAFIAADFETLHETH